MGDDYRDDDYEEKGNKPWIFYRDRPEWSDIKPVSQDDGPNPVVRIAYSEKFRDVFDYLRAVLKADEISERAFELVTDAVCLNPSNYTVWHFRRVLLQKLEKDLHKELDYIKEVIDDNPKNYQVWHHRRVIVEWLRDPFKEKEFSENILVMDAKNYHAWQHRQWVLQEFGLWDGELEYVGKLLEEDIRNNSAWNQRYFVISHTTNFTDEVLEKEIDYTLEIIKKAPHNESPWNYLRGILERKGLSSQEKVNKFCEELFQENCRAPYLLAFIIDCIIEKLPGLENGKRDDLIKRSTELCQSLADEHDSIRKEYWKFVSQDIINQYGPGEACRDKKLEETNNCLNEDAKVD